MNRPAEFTLSAARAAEGTMQVFIRDFALDARIGVHGHEQGQPQPVRINVAMDVALDGPPGDKLANVVDYETVAGAIRAIVAEGHINLAETLAERILAVCFADTRVTRARVRVEKLTALAGAAAAGVEIERPRPV